MAVWLEMARIVLGGPCARALRRLASAPPLPLSCPGALLCGSARALVRAARDAARALACSLRPACGVGRLRLLCVHRCSGRRPARGRRGRPAE